MSYLSFLPGHIYHIYNRGNNRENLFIEEINYAYFLRLYARYIHPVAVTLAYCLLGNHFHLLVRILTHPAYDPSRAFANLFSTYTKAINKRYHRTGSLFQKPFQRIPVEDDAYLRRLVVYIHRNPQKHGFVDDFRAWPHSSYPSLTDSHETIDLFDTRRAFIEAHAADPTALELLWKI